MKRTLCILTIAAFIGLCLPAQSAAQSRFTLRLTGGLNMLDGGDLNSGAEGWFDLYQIVAQALGNSTSGDFSAAKLGLNLGGDFIFKFNESLGLGIGAGFLSASKESVMTFSTPFSRGDINHQVEASAIPLRLGFFYFLPVGPTMNVVFNAGLGYYLAEAKYAATATSGGISLTDKIDASGGGLGFHGGLGLEIALMTNLGILVDLSGRFASFAGFEGEQLNQSGIIMSGSGKLYATDINSGLGAYRLLVVRSTSPSGSDVVSSAEAKVSFSGFSLTAGFFFRF